MHVEWKPNEPDDWPLAPPRDFIAIEGEPPPHRDLLDNAAAIDEALEDRRREERQRR